LSAARGILRLALALPGHVRLCARLLADARVPIGPKLLLACAIAYLIAPVDLVPDFLVPLVGELDDVAVLWLASLALVRLSPPAVVAEHRLRPAPRES